MQVLLLETISEYWWNFVKQHIYTDTLYES